MNANNLFIWNLQCRVGSLLGLDIRNFEIFHFFTEIFLFFILELK